MACREQPHLQVLHRVAARRAGRGSTVPVFVTHAEVIAESAQIVAHADRQRGASSRPLRENSTAREDILRLERDFDDRLGPHARRWMYFDLLPRRNLARAYNCTGVQRSQGLAGSPFYPLVSDLTFASLAAAALMPPEYSVPLPTPDELPAATGARVRALRAHPAGEFALRMFRDERSVHPATRLRRR